MLWGSPPTLAYYSHPHSCPLRNKRRWFDLLWRTGSCPLTDVTLPWGWVGRETGEEWGTAFQNFCKFLHGFFSLKLHLNPVRVGWAVGWRPRRLARSPGPPRALREMRLWFPSWSWADVLTWSHMKSPCLWDSQRRIKRKAPATVISHPGDAPPGLQWLESPRFGGGGGDACPGYHWGQEAWY